jgi:hypothetical protein
MIVKEKAEILVNTIAKEKAIAEEKLEAAKPALEEAAAALDTIKQAHIGKLSLIRYFTQIQLFISSFNVIIFIFSHCP